MPAVATREQIVAAADRLFYHHGYEHTSFADIAEPSACRGANFYYHFKSQGRDPGRGDRCPTGRHRRMLEQWRPKRPPRPGGSCGTSRSF
ncbi:TetR/AcrR family transcriptional regulator [Streptomyces hydrogenans]|uniref:TetR/AcrR family transcriptional regulator n=1 Tax=Streptomyces hydrogenans TaxID=1873719 RepID=UPI001CFF01F2|nr:TetR family transcriptional regulator [Streptomyces hydrogenans]